MSAPTSKSSEAFDILQCGWGMYVLIMGVVSVAMDVAFSSTALETPLLASSLPGSAILGWLFIVAVFILPAFFTRTFLTAPLNKLLAFFWCIAVYFIWVLAHSLEADFQGATPQARPNLTMIGGWALCWRLLVRPITPLAEAPLDKPLPPSKLAEQNRSDPEPPSQKQSHVDSHHPIKTPSISAEPKKASRWLISLVLPIAISSITAVAWIVGADWIKSSDNPASFKSKESLGPSNQPDRNQEAATESMNIWDTKKLQGLEYVSIDSLKRFYRFSSCNQQRDKTSLYSSECLVEFQPGFKKARINLVHLTLIHEIIWAENQTWISRLDLVRIIEPILRPSKIGHRHQLKTVVLDPMAAPLSASQSDNTKSKSFELALRVKEILEAQGVSVMLTRPWDRINDLSDRVSIANQTTDSIVISLYHNPIGDSRSTLKTLAFTAPSELSHNIINCSSVALAAALHGAVMSESGMIDGSISLAELGVFPECTRPGAMLISEPIPPADVSDEASSPITDLRLALMIVDGIMRYQRATGNK